MRETIGVIILFAGLILLLCGILWLTFAAFRRKWWLGAVTLVTIPIGPLVYGVSRYRDSKRPLLLVLMGLFLGGVPILYSRGHEYLFGLGERERVINGERYLNLTGWDRGDYGILDRKTDTVVLEMGNADVTDATLDRLAPFERLRELTLNDSAVTDVGLEKLKSLQTLESLRVARTRVTADGVKSFLEQPPPQLKQIDVSGLGVPSSVLRKWKNQAASDRRYVN